MSIVKSITRDRHRDRSAGIKTQQSQPTPSTGNIPELDAICGSALLFQIYLRINYDTYEIKVSSDNINPNGTVTRTTQVLPDGMCTMKYPYVTLDLSSFEALYREWASKQMTTVNTLYLDTLADPQTWVKTLERDVMDDVVTENYYTLQKAGARIFSPMNHLTSKLECSCTDGDMPTSPYEATLTTLSGLDQEFTVMSNCAFVGYLSLKYTPPDGNTLISSGFTMEDVKSIEGYSVGNTDPTSVIGLAMSDVKSKFTSADMDMLVAMAEGEKTVMEIYRLCKQALTIFHALKSGRWRKYAPKLWKKLKKQFKDLKNDKTGVIDIFQYPQYLSDLWLEARFAIRPMIYDIVGLLKVLEGSKPMGNEITFRAYRTSDDYEEKFLDGNDSIVGSVFVKTSTKLEARSGILASVDASNTTIQQLGLTNIGGMVFELLSYSFVLGWFVDVGNLLYLTNPSPVFSEKGT